MPHSSSGLDLTKDHFMNIEGFIACYYRPLHFFCPPPLSKMTSWNHVQLKDHFFVELSYQLLPTLSGQLIISACMYYLALLSV